MAVPLVADQGQNQREDELRLRKNHEQSDPAANQLTAVKLSLSYVIIALFIYCSNLWMRPMPYHVVSSNIRRSRRSIDV